MKATRIVRMALAAMAGIAALTACQEETMTETEMTTMHAIKVALCPQTTDGEAASAPTRELTRTIALEADSLLMQELVMDNLAQPIASDGGTRATVVTTDNIGTAYGTFGMEGFIDNYDEIPAAELGDFNMTATGQDQYISGGQCTYTSGSRSWALADGSSNAYPWHTGYQYTFWSYAPKSHAGTFAYGTAAGSRGTMTVTGYANPTDAKDQKDLLVAYNNRAYGSTNNDETVNIAFRHALAVIQFDVTALYASYGVDKVEIVNAYSTGDCDVKGSDLADSDVTKAFTWKNQGTKKTFAMTSGLEAGTDADHFFMIPQTLPTDATIKLTVTKIGQSTPVVWETTMPTSTTWKAGKVYTYKLEYVNNLFTVLGEVLTDYQANGTKTYTVNSSANWKMQVTTDGGTTWSDAVANTTYDGWIKFDKVSGSGSTDDQTVTATVTAATGVTSFTMDHAANLRSALPKGTADAPYDLSMHTIYGEERTKPVTANCYVIDAPGWYAFPLVYGNAIDWTKNTSTGVNTQAYNPIDPTSADDKFLSVFLQHEGNAIESPYITGATTAYPYWEDVPSYGLIAQTGCTILSQSQAAAKGLTACSCGYVVFQASPSTLTQGNAVIAVTNGSDILWSWHIWVTDLSLDCRTVTNTGGTFNKGVMPHNLGWVDLGTVTGYEGKNLRIRFVQMVGGTVKNEVPKRPERKEYVTESPAGQSPTYQWGRKDPFIRVNNDGTELTTYSGQEFTKDIYHNSLSISITKPANFFSASISGASTWYKGGGRYDNLWSATINVGDHLEGYTTAPVKTVYDPCPPGFQVPQKDAFNRFTKGNSWNNGYQLPTSSSGSEYIFFPGSGYRITSGSFQIYSFDRVSQYWTAAPNDNDGNRKFSYYLFLSEASVNIGGNTSGETIYKSYGLSIRPVEE